METVKTTWDLLNEMIEKRWVRYLVGALFPVLGVLLGAQALFGMQMHTASGTIRSIAIETHSSSGKYQDNMIALAGGTTHYRVEVNSFTPALSQDGFSVGQHIDLWYEQTPLFDPDVVALHIYDASGTPTSYVSHAYTDPVGTRSTNLITAAVFVLLGLLALAAGLWLPTKGETGEQETPAQAKTSYGQSVVGPPR
jgi:hypothetical protein